MLQMFVVDGAGDTDAAVRALREIGSNAHLCHMPLLVLVNKTDQPNSISVDAV